MTPRKSKLPGLLFLLVVAIIVVAVFNAKNGYDRSSSAEVVSGRSDTYANTYAKPMQAKKTSVSGATSGTVAPLSTRVYENGLYINLVLFHGTSFAPQVVTVNRGESVRFINVSGAAMHITSTVIDKVPLYRGFDQTKTVGRGETFELPFTEAGTFAYHNSIGDQSVGGVVYVK